MSGGVETLIKLPAFRIDSRETLVAKAAAPWGVP